MNEELIQLRIDKLNKMICKVPKVNSDNIVEAVELLSEILKEANTIGCFISVKKQMENYGNIRRSRS
jgi:hypothetical protein